MPKRRCTDRYDGPFTAGKSRARRNRAMRSRKSSRRRRRARSCRAGSQREQIGRLEAERRRASASRRPAAAARRSSVALDRIGLQVERVELAQPGVLVGREDRIGRAGRVSTSSRSKITWSLNVRSRSRRGQARARPRHRGRSPAARSRGWRRPPAPPSSAASRGISSRARPCRTIRPPPGARSCRVEFDAANAR